MTDGPIKIATVKANPYMLLEPDELGVLGSTRWVVEQAKHVQIKRDHVRDACAVFLKRYTPATEATSYERFHFYDGTERTVNWLLVLDALNFCFWAEKGQRGQVDIAAGTGFFFIPRCCRLRWPRGTFLQTSSNMCCRSAWCL